MPWHPRKSSGNWSLFQNRSSSRLMRSTQLRYMSAGPAVACCAWALIAVAVVAYVRAACYK